MTCGLILTDVGVAEIEAAYQAGHVVRIPVMAIGDGGGAPVELDPSVTELVGKLGEVTLIAGDVGPVFIGGTAVIPCKDYPGKTLREVGLVSESGTLIAYGVYPDTYLPEQTDQVIKEIIIKFIMALAPAESVELVIDPTIAILTIEEGDKRYYRQALCLQEVADAGADAQARARANLGVLSQEESDNRFLNADENLADITDSVQARANLGVFSQEESDSRFLNADANLADLVDKAQARNNLDTYSRGESNSLFVQGVRLGTEIGMTQADFVVSDKYRYVRAPTGCVLTGLLDASIAETGSIDNIDMVYARPIQQNINGVWVTVAG